jgi:hypothetical protein
MNKFTIEPIVIILLVLFIILLFYNENIIENFKEFVGNKYTQSNLYLRNGNSIPECYGLKKCYEKDLDPHNLQRPETFPDGIFKNFKKL